MPMAVAAINVDPANKLPTRNVERTFVRRIIVDRRQHAVEICVIAHTSVSALMRPLSNVTPTVEGLKPFLDPLQCF